MLECFNRVWAREGVTHRLNSGGQTPVRAPLYRCLACGTDRGFVEMLGGAKPVEDLVEKRSRGENGWKSGEDIIPTAGTCLFRASPLTSCFSSRFVTTLAKPTN